MNRLPTVFALAAVLLAGCSQSDSNKTSQQASKAMQDLGKAAQSVATSEPVLAARDALLTAAVKARLTAADVDTATSVWVSSHDGAVLIGGSVQKAGDVAKLRDAARGVSGVKSVRADLHVDPHLPTAKEQASDLALATRVMADIAGQTGINAFSVRAVAKNGVVTLDGRIGSAAVKSTVLEAARKTPGVKTVVDRVRVGP